MGSRANTEITDDAKAVMDVCNELRIKTGMTVKDFSAKCGMGENYWYVRQRYDAPLTLSDVSKIAAACGIPTIEIFRLADERLAAARAEIVDAIAADPDGFGVAANKDGNKRLEAETPGD